MGGGGVSKSYRVMAEGRYVKMVDQGGWEYLERKNISGVTLIVPVTDDGQVVLVEQPRVPLGKKVIEFPAGLAGDVPGTEHESLAEAARRELIEETGYDAAEMIFLTEGPPSPALNDEVIVFFMAKGLTRVGEGGGDDTEDIIVHVVGLDDIDGWLEEKRASGLLIDPKIYTGLYFIHRESH